MSPSSNTSVEVAAMLGDSVVGVKHCIDPRSGKISARTKMLLAVGAACLLAAVVAFAVSVHAATVNKTALDYWTHQLHKPAFAFRGDAPSKLFDALAFGGLSFGLTAIIFALVRVRDERRSPYYRIGSAPGVELPLEQAPTAAFPLVAPRGDDFVFNYAPGIDGELVLDGQTVPLAHAAASGMARPSPAIAGAFELPITARAKIRARVGMATMIVSAVERPRRNAVPVAVWESRTMAYFAGSLVAHLGLWALLQMFPAEGSTASIDLAMNEEITTRSQVTDHDDATKIPDQTGDGGESEAGVDTKAKLSEGEAGTKTAGNDARHVEIKNRGAESPQTARAAAIEAARSQGILGDMPALQAGITSIAAESDFASGFSANDIPGGMGDGTGEGGPGFGLGRSGFGGGGGCDHAPCGIGVGDYHFLGKGSHLGNGYGLDLGHGPGLPGHHPTAPQPHMGEAHVVGEYDKSIIRRYIKRSIDKVTYCYEHELLAHPDLGGEVLVQFFIQPNGTVGSSAGKGFDQTVASCVADVVKTIEFPAPGDGGGIQVNYPFNFHAAGK